MKKTELIRIAKNVKRKISKPEPNYISYARRIESIKTNKKICAMTFDDGPTKEEDLTLTLVNALNSFGAKGTFDVIGTTASNYPDKVGSEGTPSWSGIKFDHYPRFEKDSLAGAVNCPELIESILSSGHEITNHTYSHVIFGKKNFIYSKRKTLDGVDEVYKDVRRLHEYMSKNFAFEMSLGRPPHYVDKINGGFSSYDVYSLMGYNYLAASFDGAGWLPRDTYDKEIDDMISPLKNALSDDEFSLCGQIIFQKDGYNMSHRAPVKEALTKQLDILYSAGYNVVSVSEMLKESPFADVCSDDPDFSLFNELQKSLAIVYRDNTLRPDSNMTVGELSMLLAPKSVSVNGRIEAIKKHGKEFLHPYSTSMNWCLKKGYITTDRQNSILKYESFENLSEYFDMTIIKNSPITRRSVLKAYKM